MKLTFEAEPYQQLEEGFWLAGDARALSAFLVGETGLKLRKLLANQVAFSAMTATTKAATTYDAGYAGGIRSAAAFIDSLLRISPDPSAEDQPTEPGEKPIPSELEHLRA